MEKGKVYKRLLLAMIFLAFIVALVGVVLEIVLFNTMEANSIIYYICVIMLTCITGLFVPLLFKMIDMNISKDENSKRVNNFKLEFNDRYFKLLNCKAYIVTTYVIDEILEFYHLNSDQSYIELDFVDKLLGNNDVELNNKIIEYTKQAFKEFDLQDIIESDDYYFNKFFVLYTKVISEYEVLLSYFDDEEIDYVRNYIGEEFKIIYYLACIFMSHDYFNIGIKQTSNCTAYFKIINESKNGGN